MGDVVGITDSSGAQVATYSYSPWGEVLAVTPATPGNTTQLAIANDNPLRYRGYYYDAETSYYYLQSRYYDPGICRFINADAFQEGTTQKTEYAGTNLFCYCCNNPLINYDFSGGLIATIVLRVIGKMLCGIATQAVSDIITNLLYSNAKTTWKQVFSRRSSYYEYAAAALSAIVPGSSRSRMVARAGMNALASSFSSFCKHKRQLTIHNVGKYVLGFLTAFGISFLCELLGKGVDLQIRSLNKTKYAKFKGAPLLRKHVNNIRAMVVVIKSHMKSQLRNNKQMLVGWGTALTQALHRKYGYNY